MKQFENKIKVIVKMNFFDILLFFLITIYVLRLIKKSSFTGKLYNGDKWGEYRIGDVYNVYDHVYDSRDKENVLYHKSKFPGTIANQYINQNKTGKKNPKLLLEIIKNKTKDKSTHPDTLFLHIRVGDVICNLSDPWIKQINGPLYYSKKGDTKWWGGIVKYIKNNKIKRVVIISGSHMDKCIDESMHYINDRKKFLLSSVPGISVEYRIGQSPDEDILSCAYVDHFKTTGGGFGNLIQEINQLSKK